MNDIGKKIKQLRIEKGLTQSQLANRLMLTRSIISAYEASTRTPSLDILIKLAYIFNVSTDYLLGLKSAKNIDISSLTPSQSEIIMKLMEEFKIWHIYSKFQHHLLFTNIINLFTIKFLHAKIFKRVQLVEKPSSKVNSRN